MLGTATLLVALFATGAHAACSLPDPTVTTANGDVQGYCISDTPANVYAFMGIPFAEPPVGSLRFAKTQPLSTNWTGTRMAKTQPPRCTQVTGDPVSEDCLYLNVFAPAATAPSGGYPVLVVVHGGAFSTGAARSMGDVTEANLLASKGLVVVVVQYRLGILGFGSTGDSNMKGNWGLWDLRQNLVWIQDNIAQFGGNKNDVTMWGGSAGGSMIESLNLSPSANSLFHRIVSFSAGLRDGFYLSYVNNTLVKAAQLGLTWTDNADLKTQLMAMNASLMGSGWLTITETSYDYLKNPWGPVLDSDFFPSGTWTSIIANAPAKDRIMAFNSVEGAGLAGGLTITNTSTDQVLNYLVPAGTANRATIQAAWRSAYYSIAAATENSAQDKRAVMEAFGEKSIIGGTVDLADHLMSIHGGSMNLWMYEFDYFNPNSTAGYPFINAPFHASDQYYTCGAGGQAGWVFSANDWAVSDFLTRAIANFCIYHDPNGSGADTLSVAWQQMNSGNPDRRMIITPTPYMETALINDGRVRNATAYGVASGMWTH